MPAAEGPFPILPSSYFSSVQMDSTGAIVYPIIAENALMMSFQVIGRTSLCQGIVDRPAVRAAGTLGRDSSTEIIDVYRLCQRSTSVIQYVEVADSKGRLYCVDGLMSTPCWLKIVAFANDCQSCNVMLMTTDKGVILKTIRSITPGEPLVMWFTANVLALMNMPFLKPCNIRGRNSYICHMCNNVFEHPNPLKIHLALNCNRLESNHLWLVLANEFSLSPRSRLSLSLFPQFTFKFELTKLSRHSPARISPITAESTDSSVSLANNSSSSSFNQPSPSSSTQYSPNSSSTQVSPDSVTPVSLAMKDLAFRHSAFKPYVGQSRLLAGVASLPTTEENTLIPYNSQTIVSMPINADADARAAQMETIVSNLGKLKQGHQCVYCGKLYSRKYGLKIHIRTHTGYKPLRCKFCFRPFGDPSNLNKHVRLHADGETPYRCELCSKVLVRRRDLERHVRSRHQVDVDVEQASDTSSDEIEV